MIPARSARAARGRRRGLAGELGKTPWVDATMVSVLRDLQHEVPADWLPQTIPQASRYSVREYGCGAYGCVMPTGVEGLVLKVTGDSSEATFAHVAMGMAERDGWPEGIVRYHKLLEIQGGAVYPSGQADLGYEQLYLLWRDEVTDPGFLGGSRPRTEAEAVAAAGFNQFMVVMDALYDLLPGTLERRHEVVAKALRHMAQLEAETFILPKLALGEQPFEIVPQIERAADYGSSRRGGGSGGTLSQPTAIAALLACARMALGALVASELAAPAAEAALYYFDRGLLLSDLHTGNIARAATPPHRAIISDPGVVLAIDRQYFGAAVPKNLKLRPAPTARRRAEQPTQRAATAGVRR